MDKTDSPTNPITKRNIIFIAFISALALFSIIAVCFSLYFLNTSTLRKHTDKLRLELNESIVNAVETNFKTNFMLLEFVANIVAENSSLNAVPNDISDSINRAVFNDSENHGLSNIEIFQLNNKFSDEEWFVLASEGNNTISRATTSPISGNKAFMYAIPIKKNGKVLAILVAEENVSVIEEILKSANTFSDKAFIRLSDEMGVYMASSDNFELNSAKSVLDDLSNIWDNVEEGYKVVHDARINHSKGYSLHKRNGIMYMNIFSPVSYNGWFICSAIPENVISKKSVINSIVLVSICMFLGVVMIGVLLYIAILQQRYQKKLHFLAYTDPLTKNGNYKWFIDESEKLINENPSTKYAFVSLNIIHFKLYNKQFGRNKGDEKLIAIYSILSNYLTGGEILARANADNFRLLMKYNSIQHDIVERLKTVSVEINKIELDEKSANPYLITLCAGISPVDATDKNGKKEKLDILSCIDRCAIAINSAKAEPNSFLHCGVFNEADLISMNSKKIIEDRMRNALRDEEFSVYLQPKFSLKENRIIAAEALVRWESPSRGIEFPDSFIPVFESNGFILDLDLYVFEKVCHMLRVWIDRGIEPILISVNLSRAYIGNLSFIDSFELIRKKYGVPPKYIEFEITETAVLEKTSVLGDVVNTIHKLGYSCSIDDFGSGYSSLNLLKEIPVDTIKLDKGFFQGKKADSVQSNIIVKSVIDLAKNLNMKTVSEGIEEEGQVNFLKDANCDMIQGYYFSKPIPIPEFEKMSFGVVLSDQQCFSADDFEGFEISISDFDSDYPLASDILRNLAK